MKKLLLACAIMTLMIAPPVLAGGRSTHVAVDEYALAEPVLAFNLEGGQLSIHYMDRLSAGKIDEAGTLFRAVAAANPRLMNQLMSEALKRANDDGILEYPGDVSNYTQEQVDALNSILRDLVEADVRPTMAVAKQTISADTLTAMGWSLDIGSEERQQLQQLDLAISKDWYDPGDGNSTMESGPSLNETTMCMEDDGTCGSGGVFCPGQCVRGCDPPSSNCTSIVVPCPGCGGGGVNIQDIFHINRFSDFSER